MDAQGHGRAEGVPDGAGEGEVVVDDATAPQVFRILDGGTADRSAQATPNWLQNDEGVTTSENGGDAPAELSRTTLEYDPGQAGQAHRPADILGRSGSAVKPGGSVTDSQGPSAMTPTPGKDYKGAGVKLNASSAKTPRVPRATADKVQCAS
ncbi:hypothetical protein GCM10010129_56130 [Streptomyces fumigatiscleroticus]|nr:hypothetical protein GCM10010129_56130 [Streptomyces fumigatiscleroticus]